jgi:hypothetical protein
MSDELTEAVAIVKIGIEAEQFKNSSIGAYIYNRAKYDQEKAVEEFRKCDPNDAAAIRKLQDDMNIPFKVTAWLDEAIGVGYVKHDELRRLERK